MTPNGFHPCGGGVAPQNPGEGGPSVTAIGSVETRSIARGMEAADAMAKSAEVRLIMAAATCPGKYLIIVCGSVAAVRAAVDVGVETVGDAYADQTLIPSVHPEVIPAISAMSRVEEIKALGVVETFTMASAIMAADQAVKTAAVHLIEIRLGRGLAGKAFVVLTGEVAAVRQAVKAGVNVLQEEAMLLATTVIPSPHPELIDKIL
mgnify:CR=1 FL=1